MTRDQVLAVIESPELDRQYDAALADAINKDADAKRYLDLLPKKAVSTESAEDRATAAMVAKKNVLALEAQMEIENESCNSRYAWKERRRIVPSPGDFNRQVAGNQ